MKTDIHQRPTIGMPLQLKKVKCVIPAEAGIQLINFLICQNQQLNSISFPV